MLRWCLIRMNYSGIFLRRKLLCLCEFGANGSTWFRAWFDAILNFTLQIFWRLRLTMRWIFNLGHFLFGFKWRLLIGRIYIGFLSFLSLFGRRFFRRMFDGRSLFLCPGKRPLILFYFRRESLLESSLWLLQGLIYGKISLRWHGVIWLIEFGRWSKVAWFRNRFACFSGPWKRVALRSIFIGRSSLFGPGISPFASASFSRRSRIQSVVARLLQCFVHCEISLGRDGIINLITSKLTETKRCPLLCSWSQVSQPCCFEIWPLLQCWHRLSSTIKLWLTLPDCWTKLSLLSFDFMWNNSRVVFSDLLLWIRLPDAGIVSSRIYSWTLRHSRCGVSSRLWYRSGQWPKIFWIKWLMKAPDVRLYWPSRSWTEWIHLI